MASSGEKSTANNGKLLMFIGIVVVLVGIGVLVHEEKKQQKPLAEDFFKARKKIFSDPEMPIPVEEMTNKQKAERNIYLQTE